jgi:hypothetical protein
MKVIIKSILPNYFGKIYYKIKSFYGCLFFKINLKNYIKKKKPIFIVIGAGPTKYKKWLSTNYPWFNLIELKSYKKYFQSRNVEKILAEHVFEHLTLEEVNSDYKKLDKKIDSLEHEYKSLHQKIDSQEKTMSKASDQAKAINSSLSSAIR